MSAVFLAAMQMTAAVLAPAECPVDPTNLVSTSRANALAAALHPVAEQREACGAYVRSLSVVVKDEKMVEEKAMTLPERFDYIADRAMADVEVMRSRAQTTHRFYETLTPNQRKTVNELTLTSNRNSANAADPVEQSELAVYYGSKVEPAKWLIRPDGEIISRVYPSEARAKRIEGAATLKCSVDVDGYVSDCVVSKEDPAGMGFGNAALEATGYMRMTPAIHHGMAVASTVTLPMTFRMGDDAKPKDAAP